MTTTLQRLAEETIDPAESGVTAEFIAFMKEVSARRHPSGPIRRFNQGRAAGCVRAALIIQRRPRATLRSGRTSCGT